MAKKQKKSDKPEKKGGDKKKAGKKKSSKPEFNQQFVDRLLARIRFNEDRIKKLEGSVGQPSPTGTPNLP